MAAPNTPTLSLTRPDGAGATAVRAVGVWQVHALAQPGVIPALEASFRKAKKLAGAEVDWDLSQIDSIDHIGAQLFWNTWGRRRPSRLRLVPGQEEIFHRLEQAPELELPKLRRRRLDSVVRLGTATLAFLNHLLGFLALVGQLSLDLARFARHPRRGPWREISATIYHAGFQALGITALVGFLIGIVLSYLSAQQLRLFGGDIYLVNILGLSIIRELGPLLAAILVAGRSGSAFTAQLGVMRVTEELDAMLVMGIPHGFRLVMPKVLALALAMPLLVIWTDAAALLGGAVAAQIELGLTPQYFAQALPSAVPLANYWIGLAKGVVFGVLIALVSCHFGLRIEPNTESLGRGTTTSVVTAITVMILADAVFAIMFTGVGY